MNRFEQIKKWLNKCPQLNEYLYFNVIPDDVNSKAITTDYSAYNVINEYIDGSREIELFFNISVVKDYDKGTSDINIEAINIFDEIDAWIRTQNMESNLPDFGDTATVSEVESYSTNPDIFVNNEETKCSYQARYRIVYTERKV